MGKIERLKMLLEHIEMLQEADREKILNELETSEGLVRYYLECESPTMLGYLLENLSREKKNRMSKKC